jgi:hypothetical protein
MNCFKIAAEILHQRELAMSYDSEEDTRAHIFQVAARLEAVCRELRSRGERHDASKLGKIEKPVFDAVGPRLKDLVYGSDEYRTSVQELWPALKHHYENNSHHPEHYENGIFGMDLIDLVEMYCDWAAASLRSKDGDMNGSIEINKYHTLWHRWTARPNTPQHLEPLWRILRAASMERAYCNRSELTR